MHAIPIPVQTKVHFKNEQFLAVTYDMGVLSFVLTLSKRQRFFPLFKQFLETEMTWSQLIIVRECIFKKSELMFRVTLNGNKSGINQVYRQLRNNVNYE